MKVKGIIDEDFVNYSKPSMYIAFPACSFKCDRYNQCEICQNSSLANEPNIEVDAKSLVERYLANPLTKAFVLSGLEPFDTIVDLVSFIVCVRGDYHCNDDIVIYTGYTEEELSTGTCEGKSSTELKDFYNYICTFPNIIIKYGRFVMDDTERYDPVLGITLASHNQYAKRYNNE